jgi:hypothetical protein
MYSGVFEKKRRKITLFNRVCAIFCLVLPPPAARYPITDVRENRSRLMQSDSQEKVTGAGECCTDGSVEFE